MTRGARAELRAAARYYEDQRDELGLVFQAEVRHIVRLIAGNPEIGALVPGLSPEWPARQFPTQKFPYLVNYEIGTDGILVLAVAHGRREPLYWVLRDDV